MEELPTFRSADIWTWTSHSEIDENGCFPSRTRYLGKMFESLIPSAVAVHSDGSLEIKASSGLGSVGLVSALIWNPDPPSQIVNKFSD